MGNQSSTEPLKGFFCSDSFLIECSQYPSKSLDPYIRISIDVSNQLQPRATTPGVQLEAPFSRQGSYRYLPRIISLSTVGFLEPTLTYRVGSCYPNAIWPRSETPPTHNMTPTTRFMLSTSHTIHIGHETLSMPHGATDRASLPQMAYLESWDCGGRIGAFHQPDQPPYQQTVSLSPSIYMDRLL